MRSNSTCDQNRIGSDFLSRGYGAPQQFINHRPLETGQHVECFLPGHFQPTFHAPVRVAPSSLDLAAYIAPFFPSQNRRFQSAERKIESVAFHLGKRKLHAVGISEWRQPIDDGTARISEAEKLSDLVVRF